MTNKRFLILLLLSIATILAALFITQYSLAKPSADRQSGPSAQTTPQVYEQIEQAVRQAIEAHRESAPVMLLYQTQIDNITLTEDGSWATAWLVPLDPDSGTPIPTEPGIAIVRKEGERWTAILPFEPGWVSAVWAMPAGMVPWPGSLSPKT